jgi:hypothetical protein
MCGIVGVMNFGQGAILHNDMQVFMQMLHADAVRGMHGTGVFAVDRDGTNYRVRAGGPPHELVGGAEFEKWEKFVGEKYVRALFGHNRYATRGGHLTQFAHPFRDGHITLIHNGTLEDSYKKAIPDGKKYESDSEALTHGFATQGPEKTIKNLEGAWALVWYDGETKTINFLRNKERPLWFAKHKKDPFIAFASEVGMLQWCLNRNNKYDLEYSELPEDQWISFGLNDIKPHVKELKGKSKVFTEYGWEAWGKHMREEAVGSGKAQVESDKTVVALPPPPKRSYSSGSAGQGTLLTGNNIQNLNETRRSSKSNKSDGAKSPPYKQENAIHDLGKDSFVIVEPYDYKAIQFSTNRKDTLYQVRARHDDYPDIDFYCNIKGDTNLESVVEAAYGMRAKIKTILRSMSSVAQNPHMIHLKDPEPLYQEEPTIPTHALAPGE